MAMEIERDIELEREIEVDDKYVIHGWGYDPILIVKSKGAKFWDSTGKEYIDMMSGTAGTCGIGHSNPKVVEAVRNQVGQITNTFMGFITKPRNDLALKLKEIIPEAFSMMYFTSGGSEANETALKACMRTTGKKEVIGIMYGFHGVTLSLLSLGQPCHRVGYPQMPGFRQIPPAYCYRCFYGKEYPDCDHECAKALELKVKYGSSDDVAAFIMEPITGNGGHVQPPDSEYFHILRETCDEYDIRFIVDEIQTGFGRTGEMWGFEYFDFIPDVITGGKALGDGIPINAAIFRGDKFPDTMKKDVWHAFTQTGNLVACAAGKAAIEVIQEEDIPGKSKALGAVMTKRLKEMEKDRKLIGEVRSAGTFIGVEMVKDRETKEQAYDEASQIQKICREKGVFFGVSSKPGFGNIIKMKPPMIADPKDMLEALDILDRAIAEVEK